MAFAPFDVQDLILSPRQVGTGSPAGSALENADTFNLASGCFCFVETGPAAGEWQLDRASTAVPDGITVIAPIAGPGRWLKFSGGGGGGTITGIAGAGGITITNPVGPVATVEGAALLARDGSNGGMTANLTMGGFAITGASVLVSPVAATLGVVGLAGLTLDSGTGPLILDAGAALTWPAADGAAGQVLTTNGAGTLSFTSLPATATLQSAYDASAPNTPSILLGVPGPFEIQGPNSIILNAGGTGGTNVLSMTARGIFGSFGPGGLTMAGTGNVIFTAGGASGNMALTAGNGMLMQTAAGPLTINGSAAPADLTQITAGRMLVQSFSVLDVFGATTTVKGTTLALNGGTDDLLWPAVDGTVGQAIVTDGAGNLSFATVATSAIPLPTIQNILVAGPTPITDTLNTLARVNVAAAATVTLPTGSVGKQITVKDVSGAAAANNITVQPAAGTIDGAGSYIVATNRGSVTVVCSSTGPDVWDVI
jgi:hypothetical protein